VSRNRLRLQSAICNLQTCNGTGVQCSSTHPSHPTYPTLQHIREQINKQTNTRTFHHPPSLSVRTLQLQRQRWRSCKTVFTCHTKTATASVRSPSSADNVNVNVNFRVVCVVLSNVPYPHLFSVVLCVFLLFVVSNLLVRCCIAPDESINCCVVRSLVANCLVGLLVLSACLLACLLSVRSFAHALSFIRLVSCCCMSVRLSSVSCCSIVFLRRLKHLGRRQTECALLCHFILFMLRAACCVPWLSSQLSCC